MVPAKKIKCFFTVHKNEMKLSVYDLIVLVMFQATILLFFDSRVLLGAGVLVLELSLRTYYELFFRTLPDIIIT